MQWRAVVIEVGSAIHGTVWRGGRGEDHRGWLTDQEALGVNACPRIWVSERSQVPTIIPISYPRRVVKLFSYSCCFMKISAKYRLHEYLGTRVRTKLASQCSGVDPTCLLLLSLSLFLSRSLAPFPPPTLPLKECSFVTASCCWVGEKYQAAAAAAVCASLGARAIQCACNAMMHLHLLLHLLLLFPFPPSPACSALSPSCSSPPATTAAGKAGQAQGQGGIETAGLAVAAERGDDLL